MVGNFRKHSGLLLQSMLVSAICLTPLACGPTGGGGAGGDVVGVSTGGQEDIAQARYEISRGYLPSADMVSVEGFLSEHDIPVAQPADATELFASVGVAFRKPFNEPAPMGDLFVGFGTTMDLDAFQRPPLNLAVVIDRSGSMSNSTDDPYGHSAAAPILSPFDFLSALFVPSWQPPAQQESANSKMAAVKRAVNKLIDQLGPDDILTVISFNDRFSIDVASTHVLDRQRVRDRVAAIRPQGTTNIYAALEDGFVQVLRQHTVGRLDRVMLFTDARPNVGPEGSPEFVNLVSRYASLDVGFTLLGVGLDFGDELGREISALKGGNAFFLADEERIASVFDEDFKFMVTPAAFDVQLDIAIPAEVGIRDVYGVPDYVPGRQGASVRVPTLFFNRREGGGAIVVRLSSANIPDFASDVNFGSATLTYRLPSGETRTQQITLTLPAGTSPTGDPAFYSQPELRRAALLLDTALVLRSALRMGASGNRFGGAQLINQFLPYFDEQSLGLSNRVDPTERSLSEERALLEQTRGLLSYGGYYSGGGYVP